MKWTQAWQKLGAQLARLVGNQVADLLRNLRKIHVKTFYMVNSLLPCSAGDIYEMHRREICYLIKYLDQRANDMVMALLKTFLENTASTAEFQRMSFAPVKELHGRFSINVIEFILKVDLPYLVSPIGVPVTGSC